MLQPPNCKHYLLIKCCYLVVVVGASVRLVFLVHDTRNFCQTTCLPTHLPFPTLPTDHGGRLTRPSVLDTTRSSICGSSCLWLITGCMVSTPRVLLTASGRLAARTNAEHVCIRVLQSQQAGCGTRYTKHTVTPAPRYCCSEPVLRAQPPSLAVCCLPALTKAIFRRC